MALSAEQLQKLISNASSGPAVDGIAITPSDIDELPVPVRAIYVGGEGDITLVTVMGTELTFTSVAAGTWIPVMTKQVLDVGTDATALVGLI